MRFAFLTEDLPGTAEINPRDKIIFQVCIIGVNIDDNNVNDGQIILMLDFGVIIK